MTTWRDYFAVQLRELHAREIRQNRPRIVRVAEKGDTTVYRIKGRKVWEIKVKELWCVDWAHTEEQNA